MGRKKKRAPETEAPTAALRVGAQVTLPPHFGYEYLADERPMSGRVVYIHPRRRFFTVEFPAGERSFKENYFMSAAPKGEG